MCVVSKFETRTTSNNFQNKKSNDDEKPRDGIAEQTLEVAEIKGERGCKQSEERDRAVHL